MEGKRLAHRLAELAAALGGEGGGGGMGGRSLKRLILLPRLQLPWGVGGGQRGEGGTGVRSGEGGTGTVLPSLQLPRRRKHRLRE